MAKDYTILVGSVGGGLSVSPDGGESWDRIRTPMPIEGNVRALGVYPDTPERVLAGTDSGVYRSDDRGATWHDLGAPTDGIQVWSVAVDPLESDTIFVGTRPDAFRSRDGGKTWEELSLGVTNPCPVGTPRTTNIIVDPRDHRTVWAGIEVDGVYKSLDGGDSWVHLPDLGPDPFHGDIHGMALSPGRTTAVYATSPFGIATSTDEGESWEYHEFPKFNEGGHQVILPGDGDQARRPQRHLCGQRGHDTGDDRSHPPFQRRRQDLGCGAPSRRAKLSHILVRHNPVAAQRHSRRQRLRLHIRQRGRGRLVAEAEEGVRRSAKPGAGAELGRCFQSAFSLWWEKVGMRGSRLFSQASCS